MLPVPPVDRARRRIGLERSHEGHYARFVERFVMHGDPVSFRTLCERAVPPNTRYVVLDLDRTFHFERNLGELLGWEITAYHGYGDRHLASIESQRGPGRFVFDWSHPRSVLRYLGVGLRTWALPGLFYFLWGKLPARIERARHSSFLRFGVEPVRAVQAVPQTALLHVLAGLPLTTVRTLAERVWDHHASDQVIDETDVAWLRAHCPGVTIIVSSASPKPVLDVAARRLGVDAIAYTSVEELDGVMSSPYWLHPVFSHAREPRRIAPPSTVRINASHAKVDDLLARFPDFGDSVTVGITDTGYGEDHCWAQYFTRVIDINSSSPFPPMVAVDSPLEEVHSASVLTRDERQRRAMGDENYVDRRRRPNVLAQTLSGADLALRLGDHRNEVEVLAARYDALVPQLAKAGLAVAERVVALGKKMETVVGNYNAAGQGTRRAQLAELRGTLAELAKATAEQVKLEAPLAEVAFALARSLEAARALLGNADGVPGAG
jgi:hypothetical protein